MSDSVTIVEAVHPPPGGMPVGFDGDLIVFPHARDCDRGVYHELLVPIVKGLRTDDLKVRWLDESDRRLWSGERSALLTIVVIPFVVGIASSAGWDGLVRFLGRRNGQVKLTAGYRKNSSGGEERWVTIEGSGTDVAAALEQLNPWQASPAINKDKSAQDE